MMKGIAVFSLTLYCLATSVCPLEAQEPNETDDQASNQSPAPSAVSGPAEMAPAAVMFPPGQGDLNSFGRGNKEEQPTVRKSPMKPQEKAPVEPPAVVVPPPPPEFKQPPPVVMCNNGSGGSI